MEEPGVSPNLVPEETPAYVVDTMALTYYLQDRLPKGAKEAFEMVDRFKGIIFVPEVVIGEFIYLALKGRFGFSNPKRRVKDVLIQIFNSNSFKPLPMNELAWRIHLTLEIPELHDRMIASAAMSVGLPVITNDPELIAQAELATVWK